MKFKIIMKDPDGIGNCVRAAVVESTRALAPELSRDELAVLREDRTEAINEDIREWFEHGECVTIEVDTDTMTATVLKVEK